jgi:hypothetical protein
MESALIAVAKRKEQTAIYSNEQNEYGCPLRNQSGASAVQDFDAILLSLPPELRAAFEQERAARQAELDAFVAANGYHT